MLVVLLTTNILPHRSNIIYLTSLHYLNNELIPIGVIEVISGKRYATAAPIQSQTGAVIAQTIEAVMRANNRRTYQ